MSHSDTSSEPDHTALDNEGMQDIDWESAPASEAPALRDGSCVYVGCTQVPLTDVDSVMKAVRYHGTENKPEQPTFAHPNCWGTSFAGGDTFEGASVIQALKDTLQELEQTYTHPEIHWGFHNKLHEVLDQRAEQASGQEVPSENNNALALSEQQSQQGEARQEGAEQI